jgi:hypothetical protein
MRGRRQGLDIMNTFISSHGIAFPLAMLSAALVLLAPFIETLQGSGAARRKSYLLAAAMLGSPALVVGLAYLVVRVLFD